MKRVIRSNSNTNNKFVVRCTEQNKVWWYFTTHGAQPGSIPRDAGVEDIIDTPNGSYIALDRSLSTEELNKFEMKEKIPETIKSSLNSKDDPIMSFECPECSNHTLYDTDNEVRRILDVDYHDLCVCEECASVFYAEPQMNGNIKFVSLEKYEDEDSVFASETIESAKNIDSTISNLISELKSKVSTVMQSPEFGFPEEDVEEYSFVEVTKVDENTVKAEIRAELTFDGMMDLLDELNPIIEKYDSDAYFDMVTSGIAEAYIQVSNSIDAGYDFGGAFDIDPSEYFTKEELVEFGNSIADTLNRVLQKLNTSINIQLSDVYVDNTTEIHLEFTDMNYGTVYPTEFKVDFRRIKKPSDIYKYEHDVIMDVGRRVKEDYDEYDQVVESSEAILGDEKTISEEETAYIELILENVRIYVDENGSWEYLDETYPWATPDDDNEEYRSEKYNVYLDDVTGVVEKVDDLIITSVPYEEGDHVINGKVTLVYDVTVDVDRDYYEDELDYDEEVIKESGEASFNFSKSKAEVTVE